MRWRARAPSVISTVLRPVCTFTPRASIFAAQHAAAVVIHLHRHQARGELHHVGLEAEVAQGLGAFQAEQAAAHHHAA